MKIRNFLNTVVVWQLKNFSGGCPSMTPCEAPSDRIGTIFENIQWSTMLNDCTKFHEDILSGC